MLGNSPATSTLDELRNFINQTICHHNQLELGAFPLAEQILLRGNRPCGMLFNLQGPRAATFSAIWDSDHNTVLFYDSSGERFHKVQLVDAPRLEDATT
jgi:hypothetical protein